jgi:hypothetical protein
MTFYLLSPMRRWFKPNGDCRVFMGSGAASRQRSSHAPFPWERVSAAYRAGVPLLTLAGTFRVISPPVAADAVVVGRTVMLLASPMHFIFYRFLYLGNHFTLPSAFKLSVGDRFFRTRYATTMFINAIRAMQPSAHSTSGHDVFFVPIILDVASRAFKLGIFAHVPCSFYLFYVTLGSG